MRSSDGDPILTKELERTEFDDFNFRGSIFVTTIDFGTRDSKPGTYEVSVLSEAGSVSNVFKVVNGPGFGWTLSGQGGESGWIAPGEFLDLEIVGAEGEMAFDFALYAAGARTEDNPLGILSVFGPLETDESGYLRAAVEVGEVPDCFVVSIDPFGRVLNESNGYARADGNNGSATFYDSRRFCSNLIVGQLQPRCLQGDLTLIAADTSRLSHTGSSLDSRTGRQFLRVCFDEAADRLYFYAGSGELDSVVVDACVQTATFFRAFTPSVVFNVSIPESPSGREPAAHLGLRDRDDLTVIAGWPLHELQQGTAELEDEDVERLKCEVSS